MTFAGHIRFADDKKTIFGTGDDLHIYHTGGHNYIDVSTADQDLIFKGTDGGSDITALTLDMSEAGAAIFNGTVKVNGAGNTLELNASSGVTYQKFSENGTGRFFLATLNGADGLAFVDADGSSERMRIDATGKVGIVDTTPAEALSVTGAILAEGDHATATNAMGATAGILLHTSSPTAYVTATSSGSNNRYLQLRALNAGSANQNQLVLSYVDKQIGIGTDAPDVNSFGAGHGVLTVQSATGSAKTAMLNLSGDGNDTDATRVASLFFNDASATGAGKSLAGVEAYRASNHATDPGGDLLFSTNATGGSYAERMRIESNGAIRNMGATMAPTSHTTERTFAVSFPNGVANQKFKLILSNTWWGTFDVALTGTYSSQNMAGILEKRFGSGLNANSVYTNKSRILESLGVTSQNFHIGDIEWDSSLSKWVIVITHRVSTGNVLRLRVRTFAEPAGGGGQTSALSFTIGSVYTTDSTTYGEQKRIPCFHANLGNSTAPSANAIVFNLETFD